MSNFNRSVHRLRVRRLPLFAAFESLSAGPDERPEDTAALTGEVLTSATVKLTHGGAPRVLSGPQDCQARGGGEGEGQTGDQAGGCVQGRIASIARPGIAF